MPRIQSEEPIKLSEEASDNEILVHTHYTRSGRCAVTLFETQEEDDEYDGEPYGCIYCGFLADYGDINGDFDFYYYNGDVEEYFCASCDFSSELEFEVQTHIKQVHGG